MEDFGPDALGGEQLQQEGVGDLAIDNVRLPDPPLERPETGPDLGSIPSPMTPSSMSFSTSSRLRVG